MIAIPEGQYVRVRSGEYAGRRGVLLSPVLACEVDADSPARVFGPVKGGRHLSIAVPAGSIEKASPMVRTGPIPDIEVW